MLGWRRGMAVAALAICSTAHADGADVVEWPRGNGFPTFSEAVVRAGLADRLKSHGPITVLAPSEAAFADMADEERLLLMENKRDLSEFVLRHVFSGTAPEGLGTIRAMSGEPLRIARSGDLMAVNGVPVGRGAAAASNGVIHRLDQLFPPAAASLR